MCGIRVSVCAAVVIRTYICGILYTIFSSIDYDNEYEWTDIYTNVWTLHNWIEI